MFPDHSPTLILNSRWCQQSGWLSLSAVWRQSVNLCLMLTCYNSRIKSSNHLDNQLTNLAKQQKLKTLCSQLLKCDHFLISSFHQIFLDWGKTSLFRASPAIFWKLIYTSLLTDNRGDLCQNHHQWNCNCMLHRERERENKHCSYFFGWAWVKG